MVWGLQDGCLAILDLRKKLLTQVTGSRLTNDIGSLRLVFE